MPIINPRMSSAPENAPVQHPMLVSRGHAEVGENQGDDKDVVHREGQLDEVAGDKLEGLLSPRKGARPSAKSIARANQTADPEQRFLELDRVGAAMEQPRSSARKTRMQTTKPTQCQGGDLEPERRSRRS